MAVPFDQADDRNRVLWNPPLTGWLGDVVDAAAAVEVVGVVPVLELEEVVGIAEVEDVEAGAGH
jgi:hypothetical protein